jgi:hypothetical protein
VKFASRIIQSRYVGIGYYPRNEAERDNEHSLIYQAQGGVVK